MITVLGGVALLLWGLRMVSTGATRALGGELRTVLGRATGNRVSALLSGLGFTLLLQSSTAVVLLVSGFASRGMMTVAAGLAAALGADVGTTLVAQVLSLDLGVLGPLLALAGLIVFKAQSSKAGRNSGRILLGLGLMLVALQLIGAGAAPIRQSPVMQQVILALGDEPLLALLLGALLTLVSHSSLAMVLLLVTLARAGDMPMEVGFLLLLGVNLGGPLPALIATLGDPREARRVPLGNLVFRMVGVLAVLPFLGVLVPWMASLEAEPGRQIVHAHTLFNLCLAVVFLPLTGAAARLAERLAPPAVVEDPLAHGQPLYLRDDRGRSASQALNSATREALRMGDIVFAMLDGSIEALRSGDTARIKAIQRMDDDVDSLNEAIKFYLTEISRQPLTGAQSQRCMAVFSFVTNLEHIGDIIDNNLMDLASRKAKRHLAFSEAGEREIALLHGHLTENLQLALNIFASNDQDLAEQLLDDKRAFRDEEVRATHAHLERLQMGYAETIETSAIHLDLLRDLRRINSHITATAYPVLAPQGMGAAAAHGRGRRTDDVPGTYGLTGGSARPLR
ncbi:Na/Pi cotransporter family protein [Caenispirillum salinarum]|uniref:Na/Pi cotransporter family protein n=1 Tax=Caenispirillum salinarum TaxID=859058 RepID=UPI001F3C63EB|nr:Na/Pi cotransporter family protein [Caenispirillum salinarum]